MHKGNDGQDKQVYWKDMILTEDNILFGASTYQLGLQELSLIT
jgi:hypothetical protein